LSSIAVLKRRPTISHIGDNLPDDNAVPWDTVQHIRSGHTPGRSARIVGIVWHTLEDNVAQSSINWWETCHCGGAHFIVQKSGRIIQTVKLHDTAWHAGTTTGSGRSAFWRQNNANGSTVGIELEGKAADGFTRRQIASAKKLARWLTKQYGIVAEHRPNSLPGHKRHSDISNERSDPGPHFPMDEILAACRE
jgi:N-acetyl-anhydromuramyl-L-alanine amidase AmpD